ncbi:MAG TPA: DUF1573 domain-containing protein [Flavihumibacter sp.]
MKLKSLILALLLLSGASATQAQVLANAPSEPLQIKESHDFGHIKMGRPVNYAFTLVNTGKEPLRLENVVASCGCTTPVWSPEPIAPGKSGEITVGYNAAAEGPFEKSITLIYNGGKTKNIYIKGVVDQPNPGIPVNSSVQLLKKSN